MPLIKNELKPLAKSVLISLGLTARSSATDATICKKKFGFGRPHMLASYTTTLIILDEEINDIIKLVKSLEESVLLINSVSETVQM